jgi:hypothetical protein
VEVTQRQNVRDMFTKANVPMKISASPQEFQEFLDTVIKRWTRIIKENNIKMY